MSQAHINIKGTSYGLVIHIGSGDWSSLLAELITRLDQTPSFFKGGRVALQLGPRVLAQHQVEHVGDLLKAHQMSLWAVISDSEETRQVAAEVGLETAPSSSQTSPPDSEQPEEAIADDRTAILIRRTLRSGQSIHYPGHVVVIGDVNPGAEVVAGGDVVVWGRLRGIVHAGAGGDDSAVVCALALAPTQLRISRHIALSPGHELSRREGHLQRVKGGRTVPEVAFVQDGQIVAEPWSM
jgi:septum site-determining protein MinC